jgi:hypothetical protein
VASKILTFPLVDVSVVFWHEDVKVGEEAAFQMAIRSREGTDVGELPFSSLSIYFSDSEDAVPLVVRHQTGTAGDASPVRLVNLGRCSMSETREVQEDLRWQPGKAIIFAGTIVPTVPSVLRVSQQSLQGRVFS